MYILRWYVCVLTIVAGVLQFEVSDAASRVAPDIATALEQVVQKSGLSNQHVGVWIYDELSSKKVYGHNDDRIMVPASLSKIMTAAAALNAFPPTHQFETQVLAVNTIDDGALKGPLYLKGGGDPSLVSEKMWELVDHLLVSGVHEIRGDLIVDDSLFDSDRFDEGRESSRVDRAYDAPVGALSFNWNSVNVYIRPGAKVGAPARVIIDPPNTYIELSNKATTSKSGAASLPISRNATATGDRITVTGRIPINSSEMVVYKSITKPDLWAGSNFISFLKQRGIHVTGKAKVGKTPEHATVLASVLGSPMSQIIADMLKFSNNYVAEMLAKNMSVHHGIKPGTMKGGVEQIRSFLDLLGLQRDQYTFVNPSGLTNENKMSPSQIGIVLNYVKRAFKLYPEFLTGLPIAGIDGTLKSRLVHTDGEGRVRAKTGLLREGGVAGLGGFAASKNGTVRTFVFIYNSPGEIKDFDRVKRLFDSMALELVNR